jgi:DNA-binding NarL/FixJ family response regulator
MIKVIITAESALARRGIEQLLREPGVEIIASVASLSAFAAELEQPDVADLIISTADLVQFAALLQQLTEADPYRALPVVLLAELPNPQTTARALRMGAHAVLPVEMARPQLLAALEAVSHGLVVTVPAETEAIISASQVPASQTPVFSTPVFPTNDVDELLEPLTPREQGVLRMLALGLANKEIASRLNISEHTVKFHVAAILGKLGAASRTEAVAIGIRHGLILL